MDLGTSLLMVLGTGLLVVLLVQQLFRGTHAKERKKWLDRFKTFPYQRKWYFLSTAERAFYEALQRAVGPDMFIFSKARLFDFIWVPIDQRYRRDYLEQVLPYQVDFLLCDFHTVAPRLVIEFEEEGSPRLFEGPERDAFLESVLAASKIPFLRVKAQEGYDDVELGKLVRKTIASEDSSAVPAPASTTAPSA